MTENDGASSDCADSTQSDTEVRQRMLDEHREALSPEERELHDSVVAMVTRMVEAARAGRQVVVWEVDATLDSVALVVEQALEVSISWRSDKQPRNPKALERAKIDPYFGERFLDELTDLVLNMPRQSAPEAPST